MRCTLRVEHHGDNVTTWIWVTVTPPAGEAFSSHGEARAERLAHCTAFRVAAAVARDCPTAGGACPAVQHVDTWQKESRAVVKVEHDGEAGTIAWLDGLPSEVDVESKTVELDRESLLSLLVDGNAAAMNFDAGEASEHFNLIAELLGVRDLDRLSRDKKTEV